MAAGRIAGIGLGESGIARIGENRAIAGGAPADARASLGGGVAAVRRELRWSFLGRVPYGEAAAMQEEARLALRERARGSGAEAGGAANAAEATERLLLLEHPHVYTLGRNATASDVLASPEWLERHGVEVVECDRGGQVTYHGPGQLVGYPILDLSPDRRDVRRYVRDLEEVLIRTLADYGIAAGVRPGTALVGVWAGGEKIAAIGVHLSRWITTHGFALNVAPDLSLYAGIVACGLRREGITSMARLLGAAPPLAEVAARLACHFAAVFDRRLVRRG
jgi:lipoyl(octanoyl) transferase